MSSVSTKGAALLSLNLPLVEKSVLQTGLYSNISAFYRSEEKKKERIYSYIIRN